MSLKSLRSGRTILTTNVSVTSLPNDSSTTVETVRDMSYSDEESDTNSKIVSLNRSLSCSDVTLAALPSSQRESSLNQSFRVETEKLYFTPRLVGGTYTQTEAFFLNTDVERLSAENGEMCDVIKKLQTENKELRSALRDNSTVISELNKVVDRQDKELSQSHSTIVFLQNELKHVNEKVKSNNESVICDQPVDLDLSTRISNLEQQFQQFKSAYGFQSTDKNLPNQSLPSSVNKGQQLSQKSLNKTSKQNYTPVPVVKQPGGNTTKIVRNERSRFEHNNRFQPLIELGDGESKKNKVLIVSDEIGRDITRSLSKELPSHMEVCTFMRPGCSASLVAQDIHHVVENEQLGEDDFLIFLGGSNNVNGGNQSVPDLSSALNKIITHSNKTNVIISEVSVRHDLPPRYKNIVNKLNKIVHNKCRDSSAQVLNLAQLDRSHFSNRGHELSDAGKLLLSKQIADLVSCVHFLEKSQKQTNYT